MSKPTQVRFLRIDDVCGLVRVSRSHVYRLMQAGLFPKALRIASRYSVWRESEVEAWMAEAVAKAEAKAEEEAKAKAAAKAKATAEVEPVTGAPVESAAGLRAGKAVKAHLGESQ